MRKDVKGQTVRIILSSRVDQAVINDYGDIWEVMSIGERTAMLSLENGTMWTPNIEDIKEIETEEGGIYPIQNLKIKHKYKSFLFL